MKSELRTGKEETEVMVEVAVGLILIQMNAKFGGKCKCTSRQIYDTKRANTSTRYYTVAWNN